MAVFGLAMLWERSLILAGALGTMRRQLERCIEYAQERRQFNQPIGKFQAVSHRIVEMKLRLETARLLFNEGNDLRDKGELQAALDRYVAANELAQGESGIDAGNQPADVERDQHGRGTKGAQRRNSPAPDQPTWLRKSVRLMISFLYPQQARR